MDQDAIIQYVTDTFAGVEVMRPTDGPGAGDTFFFYDPLRNIDPQRRLPFATIVVKDYGEFDNASNLDRLMPHPVYARQSYLCVLNPSPATFETVKLLLGEAYAIVAARHAS